MTRTACSFGLLVFAAGVVAPGCSGTEFTAADGNNGGEAGESATGGNGGSGGGSGGSSSGAAGTDTGGSDVGGNGNGGSSGRGGASSGGSQMGGDAGEGATGGSGPGGRGGSSGASLGGAGSGSGGRAGASGAGTGGRGGAGAGGKGGTAGAGSGGKGGTAGAGSGGKGGTAGAGSGGKGGTAGAGPSTCPPSAPSPNSACSFMGHCSYGTHPRQACRDVYACDGVRWQQTQDASCATPPSCQDLPTPPVINAQCMPIGAECQGNLYCLCTPDCTTLCAFPPIWQCFGAPGDCPAVLPNRGQPCDVNLSCVYGSCASQTGVQAVCENGYWTWYGLICPQ